MSSATDQNWRKEFGIGNAGSKVFFASKAELDAPGVDASQGHVVRRAFDLLKLDGVLCTENTPLVYFKEVKRIGPRVRVGASGLQALLRANSRGAARHHFGAGPRTGIRQERPAGTIPGILYAKGAMSPGGRCPGEVKPVFQERPLRL